MQEIRTYNHSKRKDPAERVSIFYIAARISLLGPILCNLLVRGAAYGLKDSHGAKIILALGGITVVVSVVCVILGVFALFGMLRYGIHGVLVRAVLGILLSGLTLGWFGMGFVRGFQLALKQQLIARARAAAPQSGHDSDKESIGDSANGGDASEATTATATNSTEPGSLKSLNAHATQSRPADMSLAETALTAFNEEQGNLRTAYDVAALAINNPPVLSMKDVTQSEQLIAKKKLVNKFLDANEKWLGFSTKAEVNFREEMVKLHATQAVIDAGLKDYHQSTADREFALMRVRENDQRIGTATLKMLTVLEVNWGNWKYNVDKNTLSFSDSSAAAQYNDSLADLNDAKTEQPRLQAELSRRTETATAPAKPSL